MRRILLAGCLCGLVVPAVLATSLGREPAPGPPSSGAAAHSARQLAPTHDVSTHRGRSLAGKVLVIDPGHQLGNSTHLRQINRLVNGGGFLKPCDTTGTATNAGFPEATFTWRVALALRHQLVTHGATVYMTRYTNDYEHWGPCVDVRGRKGNTLHADAVISIHGDGAVSSVHGFFVIMPADRRGWTHDIFRSSHRYGRKVRTALVRAGARVSTSYGGDGLDTRGDLATLNWSNVPVVLVEMGNMRNALDARHMTSRWYRSHVYARGLRMGIANFVLHR
ncbi:MAG: N-acetylmuramoyl-L-alanine amidase family protein [Nocardioidaceae bacterium]